MICQECGLDKSTDDEGAHVIMHPGPASHLIIAFTCAECVEDGL